MMGAARVLPVGLFRGAKRDGLRLDLVPLNRHNPAGFGA
jgi:hypothetical protein